jgi:hypothetical protein
MNRIGEGQANKKTGGAGAGRHLFSSECILLTFAEDGIDRTIDKAIAQNPVMTAAGFGEIIKTILDNSRHR